MSPSSILFSPPFVVVDGVINIRTIGGYKIDNSLLVTPGLIFRSGEVSGITEAGKQQLLALGIRRIFDMRSNLEINSYKTASPDIPGVEFVHVPIGKEVTWDAGSFERRVKHYQENELEAFVKYAQITLEIGASALETIFRHFLERPKEPCLFHCTAGKDRTGLVAALILMLLGVDDADITKDYTLTTVGLEPAREKLAARLQNIPVFRDNQQGALNMGSSKEASMTAILAMIRQEYGSAAGYLTACTRLQAKDLDAIRDNLLNRA
ncbi:protein-tyrosine phosphatase-like protein [Mycena alexandri]|uniref:Protein-tyrosine phosphatase-like protein n=1 Tax=Mycena alexandri TaxID=1745969 RepID=A0AAD6X611_9AGAR|nr:protein-tyrosine phosphatase-like protein [Mycena alexandri]KAJ7033459.1 protein-tyrosine phosphatase-like protein [Mycena alexandri]